MKLSISTTRRETLFGWIYWLVSLFVLPAVLYMILSKPEQPVSDSVLNLAFFLLNFLAVSVIFRRFLWESLKAAAEKIPKCLGIAALGILFYFASMWLIAIFATTIKPDFSNVNDDAIFDMMDENAGALVFCTIFLVPIAEETFYRGLLFQSLQRKNRIAAYIVSVLAFAAIHVVGYIGIYDPLTLILCFAQYLPAGIILAAAYEKTDTIITPILIHIFINLIGISAQR